MEQPLFTVGQIVRLHSIHDAVAIVTRDDGDFDEVGVDIEDANATYEVVSEEWDGGFLYNLRYEGEIGEYDYIRVFGVTEDELYRS